MLKAGSSKPWPEILKEMTNQNKMSAGPILEYFKPLENWLDEIISQNKIKVGWKSTIDDYFPKSTSPTTPTTTPTTTPSTTPATTPATTPTTESKSGNNFNHYYQISIIVTAATIMINFVMLF